MMTMNKIGYIYIMTNKNRTTLYIGVTNDLCRRIYEHKNHLIKNSFTNKYNLEYCIYYEEFPYFDLAIQREKVLKKWNRQKKEDLINKKNPEWKVLVTENGFIRNTTPFSQLVNDIVNEQIPPVGWNDERQDMLNEIPPVGRNDGAQCVKGEIPPFSRNDGAMDEQIPPVGRNDERLHGFKGESGGSEAATTLSPFPPSKPVISSEARNLNSENASHSDRREESVTKKNNNE